MDAWRSGDARLRYNAGHRQDRNHKEIRDEFLRLGCTWMDTYQLGDGRPDGVAGYGGLSMCVEIKDPLNVPSKRRLTPDEQGWHRTWTGGIRIVQTKEDVAETVNVLKGWLAAIREAV